MRSFFVAAAAAGALLLFLAVEKLVLEARLKRIPIRVCVTGTRGKSSVTRLIAGALRESGTRVLAKTTGSKAVLILPDGSEREILRRGLPTILEQKRIVRLASRLRVGALVTEMMGIGEECLSVESRHLFRPNVLVLTNVRLDHTDRMGETREEIASCLASAFPAKGIVVIPEDEALPVFSERARKAGAELVLARRNPNDAGFRAGNLRLAAAAAGVLGIDGETARRGMSLARPDFGSLKAWEASEGRSVAFVNAFAANDPDSTREALSGVLGSPRSAGRAVIGLLSLRRDRGDRTLQWIRAFEDGAFAMFGRVAVMGGHGRAFVRRMNRSGSGAAGRFLYLDARSPERLFRKLAGLAEGPSLVVGLGNIGGPGSAVVEYWERTGILYDL